MPGGEVGRKFCSGGGVEGARFRTGPLPTLSEAGEETLNLVSGGNPGVNGPGGRSLGGQGHKSVSG